MSNTREYTAAVIVIGNEILSGRTQDTNTNYIASSLSDRGIRLMEARVIPDVKDTIIETVNTLRAQYDYVFTTGGIGPTHDDITAECIARAFDVELKVNDDAFRILEEYYGIEELTQARVKMAYIPVGAKLIANPVSAAPGFQMENVYVFAGVPRIMQAMMNNVVDDLRGGDPMLNASVACSLPESVMAEDVGKLQGDYDGKIEIGSYPHFRAGVLGLSIVLRSTDKETLEKATAELIVLIEGRGEVPLVSYSYN
ncbi:MAG: competence/damage-inducible protein A [Micavibrio sp.]|nr:competence/damage-inducible protein A [Micavibrio sp.]|tara:strand:- start:8569 stop:9333 length:765 start_codon:yes stop_codon:yes gene_type:complete